MTQVEMTRSASEQPDVTRPSGPAGETDSSGSAQAWNFGTALVMSSMQWEIHVELNSGMWWAMSHDLSDHILSLRAMLSAQDFSFVWKWDGVQWGSYKPDGADTPLSRHSIDCDAMHQRTMDSGRARKIEIVCAIR